MKLTTCLHLKQRFENVWNHASASHIVFVVWCLIKYKEVTVSVNCAYLYHAVQMVQLILSSQLHIEVNNSHIKILRKQMI